MRKGRCSAMVGALVACVGARAQVVVAPGPSEPARISELVASPGEPRGPGGGYGPRTPENVYDNLTLVWPNRVYGFMGACENAIDDCGFAPGPWANAHNRVITGITFGVLVETAPTTNQQVLIIFWRSPDVRFQGWTGAGSAVLNPTANPLGVARFNVGPQNPGFEYHFTMDLQDLSGGGVLVPDDDNGVAVQLAWVNNGCVPVTYRDLGACLVSGCASPSTLGICFGSNSLEPADSANNPGDANPATIGSTLPDLGRDISNAVMCPNIGWFVGNGAPPVNSGNVEHRFIVVSPTSGPNTGIPTTAGLQVLLRGTSNHCGSADFDHDGSPGTDADIAAFFACLAGNCCAACGSGDFNGDGDVATDADIEAFFFVLGGGSC